jgi:hypothetical protein
MASADIHGLHQTQKMEGTIHSIAVSSIGTPAVLLWIVDDETGQLHQMHSDLAPDASASLGMLNLLQDAAGRDHRVRVRWTDDGDTKRFHLVRMFV